MHQSRRKHFMGSHAKRKQHPASKVGAGSTQKVTSLRSLPCVQLDPYYSLIANILRRLRPMLDGIRQTQFNPDPWAIQSLWPEFLNSLTFQERMALAADLADEGSKVLFKLFSIDWMSRYDRTTREAVRLFKNKIWKNTFGTAILLGFKYQLAFFAFLQNGPKLSLEKNPMKVVEDDNKGDSNDFDGDKRYYSIYAIIESLLKSFQEQGGIPDNSIDLDLLVFWINNLDLQDAAAIKSFCQIPLNEDEAQQTEVPLRTLNDIRRFKERIFPNGSWATTSGLIYTSFCTSKVNYSALYNKLLDIKRNNCSFDGVAHVQKRELQIRTYFDGVRLMPRYQICRQRWVFTDPYEAGILCLYLGEHIDTLMSL